MVIVKKYQPIEFAVICIRKFTPFHTRRDLKRLNPFMRGVKESYQTVKLHALRYKNAPKADLKQIRCKLHHSRRRLMFLHLKTLAKLVLQAPPVLISLFLNSLSLPALRGLINACVTAVVKCISYIEDIYVAIRLLVLPSS